MSSTSPRSKDWQFEIQRGTKTYITWEGPNREDGEWHTMFVYASEVTTMYPAEAEREVQSLQNLKMPQGFKVSKPISIEGLTFVLPWTCLRGQDRPDRPGSFKVSGVLECMQTFAEVKADISVANDVLQQAIVAFKARVRQSYSRTRIGTERRRSSGRKRLGEIFQESSTK